MCFISTILLDVENVKLIIRCILRAMKYDLPEAYQLFPTLLQLPKLDDQSVRKEFIEEVSYLC